MSPVAHPSSTSRLAVRKDFWVVKNLWAGPSMEEDKMEPKEVWRKMSRRISAVQHVLHPGEENPGYMADEDIPDEDYLRMRGTDHTPHDLFVEMDVLEGDVWIEKAR